MSSPRGNGDEDDQKKVSIEAELVLLYTLLFQVFVRTVLDAKCYYSIIT